MSNKDVKDVAKKEVAQAAHEVKGELTYDDKVIQKIIGLSLEKVEGLLAIDGGFFSNLADKLINTDNVTNGVNVEVGKEQVAVDLNVVVEYQKNVPALFVLANVKTGGRGQGASTITMQLARTTFLSRERSFVRKFYEVLLKIGRAHV